MGRATFSGLDSNREERMPLLHRIESRTPSGDCCRTLDMSDDSKVDRPVLIYKREKLL